MKRSVVALGAMLATVVLASDGRARELAGVKLSESIEVSGARLRLNGVGVRTRLMLSVYVVGLYLPTRTTRAEDVIGAKTLRRVHLVLKRRVDADTMWEAFDEGIRANASPTELSAIRPALVRVEKVFRDLGEVTEGDVVDLDFAADGTTRIYYNRRAQGSFPGPALAGALLKIWLGQKPVQADVKEALLRGR